LFISFGGETITNNDGSKDKPAVNFDYGIKNNGGTEYICKDNALCDVNIENSIFTIRGENDLLYEEAATFVIEIAKYESKVTHEEKKAG
jgi:hypothetical protein